jgi:hypothetical protein
MQRPTLGNAFPIRTLGGVNTKAVQNHDVMIRDQQVQINSLRKQADNTLTSSSGSWSPAIESLDHMGAYKVTANRWKVGPMVTISITIHGGDKVVNQGVTSFSLPFVPAANFACISVPANGTDTVRIGWVAPDGKLRPTGWSGFTDDIITSATDVTKDE